MATSVSDSLCRIVEGDDDAKAWLYDTFSARLYRRLRGRYAERQGFDAEELLQDSFVFFFQHEARVLRRFLEQVAEAERTEERLGRYLWDLACGVASNRRRSLGREKSLPLADQVLRSQGAGPERRSVGRDALRRLAACIRDADGRAYLYFKMRFVDGLTPEEIALAAGWSRKATYKLKLRLNEAAEKCARRLGIR